MLWMLVTKPSPRQYGQASIATATLLGLLSIVAAHGLCNENNSVPLILSDRMHHLRSDGPREWSDFPETPEAAFLEFKFAAKSSPGERTLILRQQDVKQTWHVRLNGKDLARLPIDENEMLVYCSVPSERLIDGQNVLRIEQDSGSRQPDDVRLGQIAIDPRPRRAVLSDATIEVEVRDSDTGQLTPARITILDHHGAFQSVGAASNEHLAVRPGIVYTADGKAQFGLPTGPFTIYAGRGFEYSIDSAQIELNSGQHAHCSLSIRREVPTPGWVACDTHVHTLTHSGHGDATVHERMITLAAEGIELPIATDHNRHVDHEPFAREMHVRQFFTPVIGNEVTTSVGHFNVFPVQAAAAAPNFRSGDWKAIFASIYQTPDVKVVVLNHARDLHSGVRPFGPKLHNSVVGENLEGWQLRANAMEVVNSGAVQSDPLQLFEDWMGMLNRGHMLTPVGASDSHDVGRHFVGQGRTYIRARDDDPSAIDIDQAVNNFVQGRVMVSYGLLTEITVDGRFGPGELAPVSGNSIDVAVRVLGPGWVRADKVTLYANGQPLRESKAINDGTKSTVADGVLWTGSWQVPRPLHDVHLVAIAQGPGIDGLYWKTAKPYQPTSPDFHAQVIGASGAVWLDVDGDGRRTTAFDYAQRLSLAAGDDFQSLLAALAGYDEAVAAQAAHRWQQPGRSLFSDEAQTALRNASPQTARGIRAYLAAWRENQLARSTEVGP